MLLPAARVRTAHGDARAVEGTARERYGGGAATLRGIRVMASGLPHPQFNGGVVTGPDVDLDGARAFYAERDLPWGALVPTGMAWGVGRHVGSLPLMGVSRGGLQRPPDVPDLALRTAGPDDLETVLRVDTTAFDSDPDEFRPWTEPHLQGGPFTTAVAELDGEAVGTAFTVRSGGAAGAAVYLGGVAVLERARGHGIAGAMSAWLLERAFADGARLAHLQADTDAAARVYARLGFAPAGALDIYVDV
jgi:GNAT superfamily N-acetyltransferase